MIEGNGKKIRPEMVLGKPLAYTGSSFTWRKEHPSSQDFSIWRAALTRIQVATCVSHPLGRWICKSHRHEPWQYDKDEDVVIFRGTLHISIFTRLRTRQTREGMTFTFSRQVEEYENHTSPVTITWQGNTTNVIFMQGHSDHLGSYHEPDTEAIAPANDMHMETSAVGVKHNFIRAALRGEIRAVSDASFMPQYSPSIAAAAWRVETTCGSYHWTGSGLFCAEYNSSYGGELYGIYLILRFLHAMWPTQGCSQGCILIKCDNLGGIKECSRRELKLSRSKKFLGLLRAIRNLKFILQGRNLHTLFRHIKGH